MKPFWNKWGTSLNGDDAYDYIKRDFNGHRTSSSHGNGYENNPASEEEKLYRLGATYEKIEDYFQSLGLDPKKYSEEHRKRTYNRG